MRKTKGNTLIITGNTTNLINSIHVITKLGSAPSTKSFLIWHENFGSSELKDLQLDFYI